MRGAFVLQLASGTQPSQRHFEGHIEEVDTGRELRFRSTEELLAFLAQCVTSVRERAPESGELNPASPCEEKD
jgi:hypothetical protein